MNVEQYGSDKWPYEISEEYTDFIHLCMIGSGSIIFGIGVRDDGNFDVHDHPCVWGEKPSIVQYTPALLRNQILSGNPYGPWSYCDEFNRRILDEVYYPRGWDENCFQ